MMNRTTLVVLALLCGARPASASPLLLSPDSPLYFSFNNLEQANTSNNLVVPGYAPAAAFGDGLQGNWGLFNIASIQNGVALTTPLPEGHNDITGGGPIFFSDDGPGGAAGQITGVFYGLDLTSDTTATGGVIDLYWHDAGVGDTVDASCMAGVACLPDAATVARFTTGGAGVFLARLLFASGIIGGDVVTTLSSTTNLTTDGGSGHADAFANVDLGTLGPWSAILNGNWFFVDGADAGTTRGDAGASELRDLRLTTFFNVSLDRWDAGPAGTQGSRSNDPARVFTAAAPVPVPEPATLMLLGVGVAGLAVARRRRKA